MSEEQHDAMTEEERAAAIRQQLRDLHIVDLAYDMMVSLVTVGYQKLGLTAETAELRDLEDARLAIDLLHANLDVVGGRQGEGAVRDLRATLAQMQLNYARAVRLAGEQPEGRVEAQPEKPAEATPEAPAGSEAPAEPAAAEPAAAEPAEATAEPAATEPRRAAPKRRRASGKAGAAKKKGEAPGKKDEAPKDEPGA